MNVIVLIDIEAKNDVNNSNVSKDIKM